MKWITTNFNKLPTVLKTDDVCAVLQLSRPTVRKLFTSGELVARKAGRAWLCDREILHDFITRTEADGHDDDRCRTA